jgi:hypothetical protein
MSVVGMERRLADVVQVHKHLIPMRKSSLVK